MPRTSTAAEKYCVAIVFTGCSLSSLKKLLYGVAVMVLILVSLTLVYRPAAMFRRRANFRTNKDQVSEIILSSDFADDGFSFSTAHSEEKYLSYEPPIGSWSKQLQAFENAVIISKLLNRTLLARALASELELKRLRRFVRKTLQPDSKVYKLLDKKFTVPISSVVDFNHLSKLVRVRDVGGTYQQFLSNYKNMTRYEVCNRDSTGFWVDFIPAANNHEAWKVLEFQDFFPLFLNVPTVEPVCDYALQMQTQPYKPIPFIRGIISELGVVEEDIIYFREGSIATSDIRFLSKQRVAHAQKWALDYIRFTPYLQTKIQRMIESVKMPFNALLISKEDEEANLKKTIYVRLREMEKMKFRELTKVLYVITHTDNLTSFEPLRSKGYEIHFTKSLIPSGVSSLVRYDVTDLLGLMICKYARLYAGPSDPYLIRRGRIHEAKTKDNLFVDHVTVRWALHTIKRMHHFKTSLNITGLGFQTSKANYISCTVCKFLQGTEKHKLCFPLLSECSRLRVS